MNVLLLAAVGGADAIACRWAVTVDEVPQTVSGWPVALRLPEGPAHVVVSATPTGAGWWPQTVTLTLDADGVPALDDPATAPASVHGELILGQRVSVLQLHLSFLREATAETVAALARVPDPERLVPFGRRVRRAELRKTRADPDWPPTAWELPANASQRVVDLETPLADGRIRSTLQSVDPDVDALVFEVAGVKAPLLIAVNWPRFIAPAAGAAPAPMLLFFRPGTNQNVPFGFYSGPGLEPYPFAYDYARLGLHRYVRAEGDAYADPFPKGLPHQLQAAGRPMVSVVPCNAAGVEFGAFMQAATVDRVLRKIQRVMYRRAGVAADQAPVDLGPVCFGSFSSGTDAMAAFLGSVANRQHDFCRETLRELYWFDPPDKKVDNCIRQARLWLASEGSAEGRCIRLYCRGVHAAHAALLGHPPPRSPFVEQSADGRMTAAALPLECWRASAKEAGFPQLAAGLKAFGDTHQVIPSVMLTHAVGVGR